MRTVTFLVYALFALFAAANEYSDDDYGKDVNKYYPQDQPVGTYKDGVFIISSKCTRSCASDCKDAKILEDKAGVGSRFAERLAKVLVGECTHSDTSKGCGCRVPDDDSCAKVYTCAEVEEDPSSGSSSSKNHAKCRPKPVLSPSDYDRPCKCPKTCEASVEPGRTRLLVPDRTRLSNPNDIVSFRTRLMQKEGIQPGQTDPNAAQLDRTRLMSVDECQDKDKQNCG
ncbi:uncharacterized protein J3D65DRAFT_206234 [Phyllosticta citribraziliensis]|uniref:Uncharacterized protein n=1 Tax=Phyllosticta citribraziliensis TaxID=989973 RepID=A0ABR1M3P7_9PEZI